MKLENFFEKFDQFADAPDTVATMRGLILESAIRGKLVPHNASDETASELLKRMASVQAGQVRKQAALPPVGDDAYLQVPTGWAWTRLGNTGRIFNGDSVSESGKAELAKVEDGLPFIATKDVGYGRDALVYDNGLKVPLGDPRFKAARAKAVLICAEGGSAGRKIGITDRDICFGNKLYANEVWEGIHHRYIFYVYQAPTFFKEFAARMTGIIGGIARSEFLSLPIPIPPLAEQKRIVAKVDELMALCDRLEEQQQERETRHAVLARASLARFADAPTPANLNFLFHPSYTISPSDLRKSILILAVQGKLVPQDPNNEPAAVLVDKIRSDRRQIWEEAELAKFASSAKIPKSTSWKEKYEPAEEVETEDLPELPSTWLWLSFGGIVPQSQYGPRFGAEEYVSDGIPTVRTTDMDYRGRVELSDAPKVRIPAKAEAHWCLAQDDLLITRTGATIGKCALYDESWGRAIASAYLIRFRLTRRTVFPPFVLLFLMSPFGQRLLLSGATEMAQPNVNATNISRFPFPLPPLAEQRRIVAKVEQLMALVDELETQLTESRATAEKLMEAVVADLTTQD